MREEGQSPSGSKKSRPSTLPYVVIREVTRDFMDLLILSFYIPKEHRVIASRELAASYSKERGTLTLWARAMGMYFARLPLGGSHAGVGEYFKVSQIKVRLAPIPPQCFTLWYCFTTYI